MAKSSQTSFGIRQEGIDYFFLIMKHIDRMSEGLKEGLDVGKINTEKLISYYEQIMHLEGLLIPFLDEKFYQKRKELEMRLPGYSKTWSGKFEDQVTYFMKISDLFQLLVLQAYKTGVLKIKIRRSYNFDRELFD